MFEHDDDEFGFWRDEPTRPLERIQARLHHSHPAADDTAPTTRLPLVRRPVTIGAPGSRQHHPTQADPVVAPQPDPARVATVQVDPLLRRLGVLAVALALCVPVALALREDGTARVRATSAPTTALTVAATGAPVTAAVDAQTGAPQSVAQPVAGVDPASQATPASSANTAADTSAAPSAPSVTPAPAATAPASSATVATAAAPPSATQPKTVEAASTSASCSKRYTVVAGDYWILIAKKVSVSLNDLLAANNANTNTMLYPGRSVCLPANASAPTTVPAPTSPPTTAKPAPTAPSTTKPPATSAPTTMPPVPPKATYTPAEVTQIIREIWPDDQETEAIRIATRESRLDPTAKNYCCYGLFQIYFNVHKGWLATIGVTNATQLFDPRVNAFAALVLYNRSGGWGPWKL